MYVSSNGLSYYYGYVSLRILSYIYLSILMV